MATNWRYVPGGPAMSSRVRQQLEERNAKLFASWRRDPAREIALFALLVLVFTCLFALAVAVKRGRHDEVFGSDQGVFWMESAQRFRYVRDVWSGRGIPELDRLLQWPEGTRAWADTVLQEEIYGSLARWRGVAGEDLAAFIRALTRVVSASTILPMGLLAWAFTRRRDAAIFGAAAFAFCLPVAERGTGTVLFREDLAVPLYVWHLAFLALFARAGALPWALLSGVAFAAVCLTWKVSTFLLLGFDLWAGLALARGSLEARRLAAGLWLFLLPLGAAATLPQHLAETHFLRSSPWLLGVAITTVATLRVAIQRGGTWFWLGAVGLAFAALRLGWPRETGLDHAWDTLFARLRWGTDKPVDPSSLPFHARHYWTGNYRSPSLARLVRDWPPLALITLPGLVSFLRWLRSPAVAKDEPPRAPPRTLLDGLGLMERPVPSVLDTLGVVVVVGLGSYGLFSKFQLFAAVALASLAAVGFASVRRWRRSVRTVLVVGLLVSAGHGARWVPGLDRFIHLAPPASERWSAVSVFPSEAFDELARSIGQVTAEGDAILASFVLSPFLLTYADRPTPLHCFFEGDLLARYQEVTEAKFQSEEGFWTLARRLRVRFFLLEAHHLLRTDPRMSERYVAARMDWPHDSVLAAMQFAPQTLKHFELTWQNDWFRLYRVLPEGQSPRAPTPSTAPMWSRALFTRLFGDPLSPLKDGGMNADDAQPQDLLTATLRADDLLRAPSQGPLTAPLTLERERACQIAAQLAPWLPGPERCLAEVYTSLRRADRAAEHLHRLHALEGALLGQGAFPSSLPLMPQPVIR